MADADVILTVGRFVPDSGAPEGRVVRTEEYLAALSRELETLCVRLDSLLRDFDARVAALESAALESVAQRVSETGGDAV